MILAKKNVKTVVKREAIIFFYFVFEALINKY